MKKPKEKIDYQQEFILTFSNRKSLFSSKKIERFIVFWVFLIMTIVYVSMNIRDMEAWDFVEISALWLIHSGYNALLNIREKRVDNQIEIEQSEATSDEGDIKQ